MSTTRRDFIACSAGAFAAAGLLPWHAANAQRAWPAKPIKLVNMGPPGSPPDTYARIYAERLAKALGVPVVVDNRPGAGANLASDAVAKSPPDGYTLLYTVSSAFVVNPFIYRKLPFDVDKDLRPVSPLLAQGSFVVVNNDLPVKSLQELVAYAKEHPGELPYRARQSDDRPSPCVALFNGLDSTKEMIYGSGIQQALSRRGISSIAVDQPGVGEALRLQGLTAVVEARPPDPGRRGTSAV